MGTQGGFGALTRFASLPSWPPVPVFPGAQEMELVQGVLRIVLIIIIILVVVVVILHLRQQR